MAPIKINKTKNTPEITLDKENLFLKIEGSSYPENAADVYDPIIRWAHSLGKKVENPIRCEFYFDFLNSSSHKMLYELLIKLDDLYIDGSDVAIIWYYDDSDEDIKDKGEDLALLMKIPFTHTPI